MANIFQVEDVTLMENLGDLLKDENSIYIQLSFSFDDIANLISWGGKLFHIFDCNKMYLEVIASLMSHFFI